MARAPDPRIEQAKAMYLEGQKLVEIASQLNLPEGTVRRWKSTHKWDSERSDKNKERSDRKKDALKEEKAVVPSEVESVISNPDLSDKQRLFCLYYVRCFNAAKAYQKAYGCAYSTALGAGYKLLENTEIKAEINRLKQSRLNREFLDEHDIFQKYMDIAFADITDFLEFGSDQIDADSGDVVSKNFVHFRHHTTVDGTLIGEVKQGKDGASIKLPDRMKALQWLSDHMGWATDLQKAQIEQLRAQTDKLKADSNDIPDESVQNKMDAITGIVDQMQPLGDDDV